VAIARFFTVPCTITNPSQDPLDSDTDAEGVPEVAADEVDTYCHVQPYTVREGEAVLGVEEARRARRFWVAAGTEIRFTSSVTIGSDRFTVAGDPDNWNVGSANDHIEAVIVRQLRPGETGEEA